MIGKVFGRLLWIIIAYLISSFAAALAFVFSIAGMEGVFALDMPDLVATSFVVFPFVAMLAFVPAAAAILIAEIFRIRSWIYYSIVGGVAAFLAVSSGEMYERTVEEPYVELSLFLLVPGLVAGLVYWLIAGRGAGKAYQAIPDSADP